MKGQTKPFGDVDVIVGLDDDLQAHEIDFKRRDISAKLARELESPEDIKHSKMSFNILSRDRYQVNNLY